MSAGSTLELVGWRKRFGATEVLRDLSLRVEPGEWLTLLGPSGCGKTTVLRCVAGFDFPDAGAARLDGEDLLAMPARRRPVHTVFQHYALFPHLTVFENVAFGLRVQGRPKEEIRARVGAMLAKVRLGDLAARKPAQLSGGQQQRVALARALILQPKVLLLDEPLGALDAALRRSMQLELKAWQRELGLTCILVTHDQDEALRISDRIAVMHRGRIVQSGTPRAVYAAPRTAFIAGFLGQANLLPVRARRRGRGWELSQGVTCWYKPDAIEAEPSSPAAASSAAARVTPADTAAPEFAEEGAVFARMLCLRPEDLRLLGPAAETPGESAAPRPSWAGRVLAQVFQGETWRVQVLLASAGAPVFEVALPAREHAFAWETLSGEAVVLTFAPEAGTLLDAAEGTDAADDTHRANGGDEGVAACGSSEASHVKEAP